MDRTGPELNIPPHVRSFTRQIGCNRCVSSNHILLIKDQPTEPILSRNDDVVAPTSVDEPKVEIRMGTSSTFSDFSISDVIADPLIALVNEADCICERAFAQLMESASRVLFASTGSKLGTREKFLSLRH